MLRVLRDPRSMRDAVARRVGPHAPPGAPREPARSARRSRRTRPAWIAALPARVRARLEAARVDIEQQHRLIRWEVTRLRRALAPAGVPVVLLKGAAYRPRGAAHRARPAFQRRRHPGARRADRCRRGRPDRRWLGGDRAVLLRRAVLPRVVPRASADGAPGPRDRRGRASQHPAPHGATAARPAPAPRRGPAGGGPGPLRALSGGHGPARRLSSDPVGRAAQRAARPGRPPRARSGPSPRRPGSGRSSPSGRPSSA